MATGIGEGNILDQCLGDSNIKKITLVGQFAPHASGQNSTGGLLGCGTEIGTGNTKLQNLSDVQSMMHDSGQIIGGSHNGQAATGLPEAGSSIGQHGSESNKATVGMHSEQQGNGSCKVTGDQRAAVGQRAPGSPMAANGSNSGQHDLGSNSNTDEANAQATNPPKNKKSYAELFANNRVESEASKLTYIAPPVGNLVLGIEDIDSVETAFGFCLVGYVMGPRPRPLALKNFIMGWGNDVTFSLKENGWIRFKFPNAELRDKVLNGGPYMIFGKQLFLKKMPSCFLFSKEDMEFFPSWVQIFGLPADCWTKQALSRIASVVGKPMHTDMLTISKKGATYARILVELDAKQTRVREYPVELPTGKVILITFKYEFDPKFCDKCKSLGHTSDMCGIPRGNAKPKNSSHIDPSQAHMPVDTVSEHPAGRVSSGSSGSDAGPSGTKSGKDKGVDSEQPSQLHSPLGDACLSDPEEALPDVGLEVEGLENEDVNSVEGSDMHSLRMEDIDMDSDDLRDFLSTVVTQGQEDWRIVRRKNKGKKQGKNVNKKFDGNSGYNDDMGKFFENMANTSGASQGKAMSKGMESPSGTKCIPKGDALPKGKQERNTGKKKIDEVRPPKTASGCP